jgi:NADH-quinone oxidoreductase subunit J
MKSVVFYILSAITLVSAILVVFLRKPLHNVLFMILTMLGLAGLFILLQAEFVAMVQVIVYAGAVMVLFLFVIMLLNLDQLALPDDPIAVRRWVGGLMAVGVSVLILPVLGLFVPPIGVGTPGVPLGGEPVSNTLLIARELFTTYLLPFEIASVLLLAAMIGAVLLARKKG